ncbi:MAG: HU family DNA-binding protein [Clostridia bacterium]|nr:HU family DNA-binding protein [Clostridia bacterium]
MNKKMMINCIAQKTKLQKSTIKKVLSGLENVVFDALSKGETINFSGFAKLYTKQRNERTFVNFQTGESFISPTKVIPAVKFSKNLILKL